MNILPNILIFSVFQKSRDMQLNAATHSRVLMELHRRNLPVMELYGKYDGKEELSILVQGFEHREVVETLCAQFNQECYLESHNDRFTSLVYPDGRRQHIGKLQGVSKEEAERNGSYSYNPRVDAYYIAS